MTLDEPPQFVTDVSSLENVQRAHPFAALLFIVQMGKVRTRKWKQMLPGPMT